MSSAPTVGAWVASLEPSPPPALVTRLTELLEPFRSWPVERAPDACLEAGERLLAELLVSGSTERRTALDLLAVDALVTYAFQAGADEPDQIEARAALAMQRISSLPQAPRD